MKVWVNGVISEPDAARISPFDHGFTVGDGVFETCKVVDRTPFALTGSAVDPDGDALTYAWTTSCAGTIDAGPVGTDRFRVAVADVPPEERVSGAGSTPITRSSALALACAR